MWTQGGSARGVLWPLVEALRRIPSLADRNGRNLLVRMLCDELREELPVEEHRLAFGHLFSIVEVCGQRPDGLSALVRVLGRIEQESKPMAEVRAAVRGMSALPLWSHEERRPVFDLLRGVVVDDLPEIYRATAGPSAPPLRERSTPLDALRLLETLNAEPDGLPKPLLFVERVAAVTSAELASELRRWSDARAVDMGLTAELDDLRRKLGSPAPAQARPANAYVVFQLQPEGTSGEVYRLLHWRQLDLSGGWYPERGEDHTGDLASVKHRVADVLEEVEAAWSEQAPAIHVEFVLSAEVLNLDVDQWPWETDNPLPEPLGCRYPVVVRSLERMGKRKWHRMWRTRWRELRSQLEGSGAIAEEAGCWGRDGSADGLRELIAAFDRKPSAVSLVLSSPPRAESAGRDEVAVGLRAGVPVMLWHREDCGAAFTDAARRLLHDSDPRDLLERVRLARTGAFHQGPGSRHCGAALTVLWDDPARVVAPVRPTPPEGVSAA
ncbi:hypothetical protein JOF41_003878 [Saccharothrix coeruleofusca]|uniref:VMAP-C domain-containing protein n=1 Tax=Saccharothrix coeruleofusca TaxID=33919 RepID=UPI001AE7BB54|nr:hypothetical protein [Saccharothrix coeruleofusca]MBP2337700.1 hypothetical protein [Saccharothrix coeruleofusca]